MKCVFFLQTSNLHPNKQKYKSEKKTFFFLLYKIIIKTFVPSSLPSFVSMTATGASLSLALNTATAFMAIIKTKNTYE